MRGRVIPRNLERHRILSERLRENRSVAIANDRFSTADVCIAESRERVDRDQFRKAFVKSAGGVMRCSRFVRLVAVCFVVGVIGSQWAVADSSVSVKTQSTANGREVFRVGFPPDENPQEIIRKNTPLLEYLKAKTGIKEMELIVPATYTAAVEQMLRGELDMVYFGGLTYVLARKEVDITPIVRGVADGTADNFSLIIARKDRGIKSVADLRGKRFAFGDVASTSGSLIPQKILVSHGIDPNKDLKEVIYTGAHDRTALAVFEGKVDAGGMNARKYPVMLAKGQISEDVIQVIYRSEPFGDYPWAVRSNVGNELIEKLRRAFIELKDPAMLSLLGVQGYQATADSDFENIREAARSLGFLED